MKCFIVVAIKLVILGLIPLSLCAQSAQVEEDLNLLLGHRGSFIRYSTPALREAFSRLEATPAEYVEALQGRIILPPNEDLTSYPLLYENNIEKKLSVLATLGGDHLDRLGVIEVLEWLYREVVNDIDIMQNELAKDPPSDANSLNDALFDAEYLCLIVMQYLVRFEAVTFLGNAFKRYGTQTEYLQGYIENYSLSLAGAFPPTQPLDVTGTWQLVGLPLEPFDGFVENVFSSSTLEQRPFSWDGQQYVYEDTLGAGKGYWVNAETAGTETVAGVLQEEVTLDLFEGWNLIAPPNCGSTDLHRFQIVDENGNTFFETPIFGYGENGYYELTPPDYYLQTGSGYWFKTDRALTITMDCNQVYGSKTMPESFQVPDTFGIITVKDEAGGNQTLYFGSTLPEGVTQSFAMPPLPFEGTFDARLVDDARLTEDEMATIRVQVQQYPLTVVLARPPNTNNVSYVLETMVNNQIVRTQPITPGSPIQVMSEDVSILRIRPE